MLLANIFEGVFTLVVLFLQVHFLFLRVHFFFLQVYFFFLLVEPLQKELVIILAISSSYK